MKKFNKYLMAGALVVACAFVLAGPIASLAATAPSLGTIRTYGIVSDTWTNSLNAGLETAVIGGVCYTTPPSTPPISINGVTVTPLSLAVVPCVNGADQATLLSALNSQSCTSLGSNVVLSGTYTPGCYSSSGTMDITLNTTVTLNGPGAYIFRSGGALTTGANSRVVLTNGATANDVFWTPGGAVLIGANSATSATPTFVGNIIADALGSTGIGLGHFVNLRGRLLAFGHTVTTDSNTITVPTTLHVVKLVVGGTATPSSFTVHVKQGGVDIGGSPTVGVSAPGTSYSLSAGTYTVSEDANSSYVQTFTGTGCDSSGNVTLVTGDDKTCTIVNTFIPLVTPVVTAPGGGRIIPLIGVVKVPTPLALPVGSGSVTYNYTAWNVGGQQALTNVTLTDDKCGPVAFLSGDLNSNSKLDPGEYWKYSCTTTLSETTTNTAIAIGHSDDGANQATIATAVATVAVGSVLAPPLTPPLINIVKVPSRLTPFSAGGGAVTYAYTVVNPGVVAMHDVVVTDDKCGPVSRISGDLNSNNLLEPGEAWAYTCQTNISVSTRNVATAEGRANGFTALGYAFADVLVSAPGLPATGFIPEDRGVSGYIVIASGLLLLALVGFAVISKRRTA